MKRALWLSIASVWVACSDSVGANTAPDAGVVDSSRPAQPATDGGAAVDASDSGVAAPLPHPELGANVDGAGVKFAVWAPNAASAWVEGDFGKVAMTRGADDVFRARVEPAAAGAHYHYLFDGPGGAVTRLDPYGRQVDAGRSVVVDPNTYAWKSGAFKRPPREQTVVYELHIGSFSAGSSGFGTFDSTTTKLAELAELGVNAIEALPVQYFGGKPNGWGYSSQLFFAPKVDYGAPDSLRAMVDAAHGLGIGVWLDTVVNHMDAWSQAPLRCFDGPCNGAAGVYYFGPGNFATTPWGPRPDYTKPKVADMLVDSAAQWLTEYRGDGFRWDSVSNIRGLDGQGSVPGGKDLLVRANALIHSQGALSVAEDLKGWDAITRPASGGGFGFDAQWDGFGYDVMNQLALSSDDSRDLGAIAGALTGNYAGDAFARLLFVEDHDTVGNGGARLTAKIDAANPQSWTARKRAILGGVLLLTAPGVPMLFMGQESANVDPFRSPPDPLAAPTPAGQKVRAFYKDMIALRENRSGDSAGLTETGLEVMHRNDPAKVIGYRRFGASKQDVIVLVNLRNKAYTEYDVGVPDAGPWRVRVNTESLAYGDDFGAGQTGSITAKQASKDGKPFSLPVVLAPYSAVVLTH